MRENHAVRVHASYLLIFVAVAAVVVALGFALLRTEKWRAPAWLTLFVGLGALALLALMQLTGRLGPEQLWFRAPTFYIASVILVSAAVWWLRRPAALALRFGLPAVLLACVATAALITRLDGRSVPLAMLMPTLDAPAPELSYFDTTGRKRTLAELHGNVVLLNFWATWCAPCRLEMPMLSGLQRAHANQGLVVLYVSLEEPEVLAPFLAANRFDGIQGRLDRAAPYYDAGKFYPLSFLISRDGRVAHRWSGRPREDWLAAQVAAQL
jgi:cytochrome c biogenesis protein CcmG, thiol:disulfide interchange protein DsbE